MPQSLPARPNLAQLRHRAKELKEAASAGDQATLERLQGYRQAGAPVTLALAQLAIAREHGFASWARLKAEVERLTTELAERVDRFLAASVTGRGGRAARLLRNDPDIASYDFRTAAMLPGCGRCSPPTRAWPPARILPRAGRRCSVRACRTGTRSGSPPPTATRWTSSTRCSPARPGWSRWPGCCWTLFAAAGCVNHPGVTELLLQRGARVDDHTVYLAAFHADRNRATPDRGRQIRGGEGHECLRLLLAHGGLSADSTALAAPISIGDPEGVRLMLAAGADPNRALPAELFGEAYSGKPALRPLTAAVEFGCPTAIVKALLRYGADPDGRGPGEPGPDGRSPLRVAVRRGAADVAAVLRGHGARDDTTEVDRFLDVCTRADRAEARRLLGANPGLSAHLTDDDRAAIVHAADRGNAAAVRLMLDLGFPVDARAAPDGVTALHAAAGSGSLDVVRLLLAAGAGIEARDTTFDSTPLTWAAVGSGCRLGHNPDPDWVGTVRTLIEAGADTAGVWVPHKTPNKEVMRLLFSLGIVPPGKDPELIRLD